MHMRHHELERRKENIGKLKSIIWALRSMAALRVQRTRKPVIGTRQYLDVVSQSIARLKDYQSDLSRGERKSHKPLLITFCSEYGFVGSFNRPLLEKTRSLAAQGMDVALIGSRASLLLAEYDLKPIWAVAMSSERTTVQKTTRAVAARMFQAVREGVSSVKLLYMEQNGTQSAKLIYRPLFPVEAGQFPDPGNRDDLPLMNMPPEELLRYLTEEYLMASLGCAVMESLHAENYSRLNAMEQAHLNIIKKYEQLDQLSHQMWQEEITTELLDIITGFVAQTAH